MCGTGVSGAAKIEFGERSQKGLVAAMLPIVHQVLGTVLVLTGLVVLPLPLPFGAIMLVIGFALLAPYIPAVQKLLRYLRAKWPKVNTALERYRHRFPPVIRRTIDKTNPSAPPAE